MQIKKPNSHQLKLLKELYISSFPSYERKPFWLMWLWQASGKMEILCLCEGEIFCGLVITALCEDIVLIDYLAVSEDARGMGIGSKAIDLIRRRYVGKRIMLEIESTLKPCDDMETRLRRKHFYLKNGLKENGISVLLFKTEMELLVFGRDVSFEEYKNIYRSLSERLASNVNPIEG